MTIEINRIHVCPDEAAAFEAAFAQAAALLRTVDGCRAVALLRCIERPGRYQVQVDWVRIEDHVDHYPASTQAAQIRALLRPFILESDPAHFEAVDGR